jgi:predicted ATPase
VLTSLQVRNFRSLRAVDVVFSPTGLTVVVGANGTGKSNLIKCLEFLGTIPREGLETTIRANNGADAILPKALATRNLRHTEVSFSYSVELPRPEVYPDNGPPIVVAHELVLQALTTRVLDNKDEKLTFGEPLRVQAAIAAAAGREPPEDVPSSWLLLHRTQSGEVSVTATPAMSGRFLPRYLDWIGLPYLRATFEKLEPAELSEALTQIFRPRPIGGATPDSSARGVTSLLDPSGPSILYFSRHAGAFKEYMSSIRRFDLQLSQLRRQQDISTNKELSPDGRGLPAAVRSLKSHSGERGNWQRLALTLSELAPHVADTSISQLKSGQEFVQFIESRSGRPVESWQSSDGTLRALAILLAVETHPPTGTLLVEEPEQGLHPWAVRTLISHLRNVIAERQIQIVLTTHSPQVLDSVEPSEILVASRTPTEGTRFQTIDEITDHASLERGEIGRMWVAGVLGGVPSYE